LATVFCIKNQESSIKHRASLKDFCEEKEVYFLKNEKTIKQID